VDCEAHSADIWDVLGVGGLGLRLFGQTKRSAFLSTQPSDAYSVRDGWLENRRCIYSL
jgi:hypothetical protein